MTTDTLPSTLIQRGFSLEGVERLADGSIKPAALVEAVCAFIGAPDATSEAMRFEYQAFGLAITPKTDLRKFAAAGATSIPHGKKVAAWVGVHPHTLWPASYEAPTCHADRKDDPLVLLSQLRGGIDALVRGKGNRIWMNILIDHVQLSIIALQEAAGE